MLADLPLNIEDVHLFMMAPANTRSIFVMKCLRRFAMAYAHGRRVTVDNLFTVQHAVPNTIEELRTLEEHHKAVELYLWLSMHHPQSFFEYARLALLQRHYQLAIHRGLERLSTAIKMQRERNAAPDDDPTMAAAGARDAGPEEGDDAEPARDWTLTQTPDGRQDDELAELERALTKISKDTSS